MGMVWTVPKQEDYANERGEETPRHRTPEKWVREEDRRMSSGMDWDIVEKEIEERKRERELRKRDKIRKKVEEWENGNGTGTDGAPSFMSKTYMPPRLRQHVLEEEREGGGGRGFLPPPWVPAYVPAFMPVMQMYENHYVSANLPLPVYPLITEPGSRGDGQYVGYQSPLPQSYTNAIEEEPISPLQPETNAEDPSSSIAGFEDDVLSASVHQRPVSGQPMRGPDIIFIDDEYPRPVREYMEEKKKRQENIMRRPRERERAEAGDSSSSGSSSTSADEEVRRGTIPTATQRPTFHFPQAPWRMDLGIIPRSYPIQW